MTWTETLAAMGDDLGDERGEVEELAQRIAINPSRIAHGTKRSIAMLAVMLGAELEGVRAERDAMFEVAQSMAEKGGES